MKDLKAIMFYENNEYGKYKFISVKIERNTEKAIQIKIKSELTQYPGLERERLEWLPKSQIEIGSKGIAMPLWVVGQKRLDGYVHDITEYTGELTFSPFSKEEQRFHSLDEMDEYTNRKAIEIIN